MRRRVGGRPRWRGGLRANSSVNLISMMDILTVLLLFLLKSYSASGQGMVPPAGVLLPTSTAQEPPQPSLVVVIDDDRILVDDQKVATVQDALSGEGLEIAPLTARLQSVREAEATAANAAHRPLPPSRLATIQGDRDIEFRLLKRVMYTLNQNGYGDVSLAVFQKS